MRMRCAIHCEAKDGSFVRRCPLDLYPVQTRQFCNSVIAQAVLMSRNRIHSSIHHVIDGRAKTNHLNDPWCASFKLHRGVVIDDT